MTLRGADVVAASPLMDLDMVAARPLVDLRVAAKRVREPNGDRRTLVADSRFVLTERDGSVAIRGRSGAGKTTLLRMLAGLDADYDGEYRLDGILLPKSVRELVRIRQGTIGYVTQVPRLLTDRSVLDNVLLGLSHASHAVEEAGLLLERVGLPLYQRKRARRLSGGEAQRVALVQTLVRRPRILLADEPTGSLDEETERVILDLLVDLQSEGVRVVVATHSDLVAETCGRSVWIREKRLVSA